MIDNFTVKPGDVIHAEILCVANCTSDLQTWKMFIENLNISERDAPFNKTVQYNSSRLTAEWIDEETDVVGVQQQLTQFKAAYYNDSFAEIDGDYGPISNFTFYNLTMYNETLLAYSPVSSLLNSGSSFIVVRAPISNVIPSLNLTSNAIEYDVQNLIAATPALPTDETNIINDLLPRLKAWVSTAVN
jgi:hypothetical protein